MYYRAGFVIIEIRYILAQWSFPAGLKKQDGGILGVLLYRQLEQNLVPVVKAAMKPANIVFKQFAVLNAYASIVCW